MSRSDQHERYEELAAGYALGALEPEDEQTFLTHLHGCARCERDLAVHLSTLTHLAYAPDAAEPPASLLDGIRAGVLASGRGSSLSEVAEVVPLDAARSRRLGLGQLHRARAMTAVAAAAALVVGLGVWNVTLQSDRSQQEQWGERMTAAVRELGVPGTDTVPLTVGDDVVAVALVRGDELSLVVDGLAANDTSSTTYVLWGQSRFGDVRPVAAFDVTEEGLDVREGLHLQAGVADVTRFMVTHEQGRVAPPIPSPVLASGDV
jgi:anti-sigma-K factor RskA